MKCRVIDANIILRFLLDDSPDQAKQCRTLFARLQAGEEEVYLPEVVLSDVVWTLKSFYHWSHERIARLAHDLLSLKGVQMTRHAMIRRALTIYVDHRIDYSDALIAAEMIHEGYTQIYSFDRDSSRVADIERIEP